jgi:hypothetical protein
MATRQLFQFGMTGMQRNGRGNCVLATRTPSDDLVLIEVTASGAIVKTRTIELGDVATLRKASARKAARAEKKARESVEAAIALYQLTGTFAVRVGNAAKGRWVFLDRKHPDGTTTLVCARPVNDAEWALPLYVMGWHDALAARRS